MTRRWKTGWIAKGVAWLIVIGLNVLWWSKLPWFFIALEPVLFALDAFAIRYEWRKMRASLITVAKFMAAPDWTIFHGDAENPGPIQWAVFTIEPADAYPMDVEQRMEQLGIWLEGPLIEDDWVVSPWRWRWFRWSRPDDLDAALAFLNKGGTLCKVPDAVGSKYWRLLVVHGKEAPV